ncbi:MAG TPA: winged helix-turn-helix domain-containing protein [Candidatus Paceibacterota bacterium]
MNSLILKLRELREQTGQLVQATSKKCGVSADVLMAWESGGQQPSADELVKWAAGLGFELTPTPLDDQHVVYVDAEGNAAVDGKRVNLTPKESRALQRLARTPGQLVPHAQLLRHLYGNNPPPGQTAVRGLMAKLRRQLTPAKIEGQWGQGYIISGIVAES